MRDVDRDHVGDFGHHALDFQLVEDLLEHGAFLLTLGLAFELNGDGDGHALVQIDASEVDVEHFLPEGIVLHVFEQHRLIGAADGQVEQVRAVRDVGRDLLAVDLQREDVLVVSVHDRRDEPGLAKPLVRAIRARHACLL
ncbi:MAG: hypothetical protein QM762_13025 [Chryseolinea sp.]